MGKRQTLRAVVVAANPDFPLLSSRREIEITGRRNCETLRRLIEAGRRGISSLDHPGLRLSHYIFRLRGFGLDIETVNVRCGDVTYGLYKLASNVVINDDSDGRAAA